MHLGAAVVGQRRGTQSVGSMPTVHWTRALMPAPMAVWTQLSYSRMERSSSVGHSIPSVAVGQARRHGTGLGGSTLTARSTRVSTQGWISTSMRLLCRRMERLSSAARFRPWSLAVQGRCVAESDGSTPTVHSIRASIRDRTAGSTRSWSNRMGKSSLGDPSRGSAVGGSLRSQDRNGFESGGSTPTGRSILASTRVQSRRFTLWRFNRMGRFSPAADFSRSAAER